MVNKDRERHDTFREYRRDSIKLFILRTLLIWGFIIPLVVFWDRQIFRFVAFIITAIAWYKYWTRKINSVLDAKWDYKGFENGLELLRKRSPKSKEEIRKGTLETCNEDTNKELIMRLLRIKHESNL